MASVYSGGIVFFKVPMQCFSAVPDSTALTGNLRADVSIGASYGPCPPTPRWILQPPPGVAGRDELALGHLGFVGAAAQTHCKGLRLADPSACFSVSPASVARQVTYSCSHFFIPKDKDTASKSARGQMLEPQKNGSYSVGPFR